MTKEKTFLTTCSIKNYSWSASQVVSQAESRLRHKDTVGTTAVGRQGLGNKKPQRWTSSSNKERSEMVQREIRLTEEEDRHSSAVGMGGQCAWTGWKTTKRHLTWQTFGTTSNYDPSFC